MSQHQSSCESRKRAQLWKGVGDCWSSHCVGVGALVSSVLCLVVCSLCVCVVVVVLVLVLVMVLFSQPHTTSPPKHTHTKQASTTHNPPMHWPQHSWTTSNPRPLLMPNNFDVFCCYQLLQHLSGQFIGIDKASARHVYSIFMTRTKNEREKTQKIIGGGGRKKVLVKLTNKVFI